MTAATSFGPAGFWREIGELWEALPPSRKHLEWPEWERFFEIAERHRMIVFAGDGSIEGVAQGIIGRGLGMQYQRVKDALTEGISAYQFHLREQKAIEEFSRRQAERVEQERQDLVERREREQNEKSRLRSGSVRVFTPRQIREEDEVSV